MCGFLVYIHTGQSNTQRFEDALNLQRHRGPDDSGVVALEEERMLLGHRRLSVIDLDHSAAQPMMSEDETIVIVFNGEIYNYIEIRQELIERGHSFRTKGDTEVLLNAYKEYGIHFLDKLIGMYSFFLHDRTKSESYIVRDRLGIKPLYYCETDEGFIASSEVKSILHLLDAPLSVNLTALSSYFSFRYPILNDTYFNEIHSVEPGTYLKLSRKEIEVVKYWDLSTFCTSQKEDKGEEFYITRLKELLQSSIKYRQIADVKVGAYLSGGVDSSAIVAIMSKNSLSAVPTFSIGFSESGYNEFDYASRVATRYQTDHHEIVLDGKGYFDEIEKLICIKDAPLSVPNEIPLYLMSKELKKYITVVLSGEGADEIFGGYGRIFRSADEYEKLLSILQKETKSAAENEFLKKIQLKYGRTEFEDEVDHFLAIYSYTSERQKDRFLSPEVHNEKVTKKFENRIRSLFDELGEAESYVNKMMYVFEKIHLVGLLQRVDMTTMAASVEARVPFVDHRLVEFAFSIPVKYKLKWISASTHEEALLVSEEISEILDVPKYILKKALEDELDQDILYRKKMGFPVPLDDWFGSKFSGYAKSIISDPGNPAAHFFNIDELCKFIDGEIKNHSDALIIWMAVNVFIFFNKVALRPQG